MNRTITSISLATGIVVLIIFTYFVSTRFFVTTENPQQFAPSTSEAPKLSVSTVADGLDHPWGIDFLPNETMIVTERSGDISTINNAKKTVLHKPSDVVARGEGGLLGLVVDTNFAANRFIFACFNTQEDIRVVRWKVNNSTTALSDRTDIVQNIPANPSGRHSGCQLAMGDDGVLWIGTGDAAQSSHPQNLQSLGGKILRVDREGKPVRGNSTEGDPRIFSYGHRNTQGLVLLDKPQNKVYGYSAEHGSSRDDEVNELRTGNFGWDPGAGYDESVAMTDTKKFPDAIEAVWSSGDTTIAVGGLAVLEGAKWGAWQDRLAIAVLKDQHLRIIDGKKGSAAEQITVLENSYGRLRAAKLGPDGLLYVSSDGVVGGDKIIRITPEVNGR